MTCLMQKHMYHVYTGVCVCVTSTTTSLVKTTTKYHVTVTSVAVSQLLSVFVLLLKFTVLLLVNSSTI